MNRNLIYWGDIPVPFVAAWSSEAGILIRFDRVIGACGVFRDGERGIGKPIFGKMDESRVRLVLRENRCQVCAQHLGRESFVFDVQKGTYGDCPIMNEPLACERCFRLALAICPGVKRQHGKPRAFGAIVRRYECIASHLGVYEGDGADAALNEALKAWKGPRPVGYLRPALVDYDVLDLDAFLADSRRADMGRRGAGPQLQGGRSA